MSKTIRGVSGVRNKDAIVAHFRHAGPMKHRNTPRSGASNWRDLVEPCAYCGEEHEEPCCLAAEEAEYGSLAPHEGEEWNDDCPPATFDGGRPYCTGRFSSWGGDVK